MKSGPWMNLMLWTLINNSGLITLKELREFWTLGYSSTRGIRSLELKQRVSKTLKSIHDTVNRLQKRGLIVIRYKENLPLNTNKKMQSIGLTRRGWGYSVRECIIDSKTNPNIRVYGRKGTIIGVYELPPEHTHPAWNQP